jgi:hypothetical protein
MISVVGKVMASLAAIDYIKTAAIAYYRKDLAHRPARLISIVLRSTGMSCSVN